MGLILFIYLQIELQEEQEFVLYYGIYHKQFLLMVVGEFGFVFDMFMVLLLLKVPEVY